MENLTEENISASILVTGNTVIDALLYSLKIVKGNPTNFIKILKLSIKFKEVILSYVSQKENHGKGLKTYVKRSQKFLK